MFAVVKSEWRNDPVILDLFSNEEDAEAARDAEGRGHFVWKISPPRNFSELMESRGDTI